jgi:hypothetical protein
MAPSATAPPPTTSFDYQVQRRTFFFSLPPLNTVPHQTDNLMALKVNVCELKTESPAEEGSLALLQGGV